MNYLISKIILKIKLLKNKGRTYKDYKNDLVEIEKDKINEIGFFKNIYKAYSKKCLKNNIMDLDDLLLNTYLLFQNNKEILEKYQNKFEYILIDEYQDTNHIQFKILKLLAHKKKKICVVGDDYQSIYSFRGADISNFERFQNEFLNFKKFELNKNYRSTQNIINSANNLIENNKNQMKKQLFSEINENDEKINILINEDDIKETEDIADIIKKLISEKKCNYKDIAILYRKNIQAFSFQKMFFKKNIPYAIKENILFGSKIIQIIFNYLKYIINPNLDNCLKKIINYPPRNIEQKIQNKLYSLAESKNVNYWEIINNCNDKDKIKEYNIDEELQIRLLPFKEIINNLQIMTPNKTVSRIVDKLIKYIKLEEYLKKNDISSLDKIDKFLERVKDIEEEYIISKELPKLTLTNFLKITTEYYDNNNINIDGKDTINLLTIHRAKGLEFKYVFIVGLEEGFYPCCSWVEEYIEEERRILYVAITRAKLNCYISYAKLRTIGNTKVERTESRFLHEINKNDLIQIIDFTKNNAKINDENIYNKKIIKNNNIISLEGKEDMNFIINDNENNLKIENINDLTYKNGKKNEFLNKKRNNSQ